MSSQPKEEQAQKGKSMQECSPEEMQMVGHLVMGQALGCGAPWTKGREAEQTSEADACLYTETRLMPTVPLITYAGMWPVFWAASSGFRGREPFE